MRFHSNLKLQVIVDDIVVVGGGDGATTTVIVECFWWWMMGGEWRRKTKDGEKLREYTCRWYNCN